MNARWVGSALAMLLSSMSAALEPLSDASLATVSARDGIAVSLESAGTVSASQATWVTDDNGLNDFSCSGGTVNQHACTQFNSIQLSGPDGAGSWSHQWALDTGSNGSDVRLGITGNWTNQRLVLGGLTLNTPAYDASAASLGTFAIQSEGDFFYVNRGLLNSGGDYANLRYHAEGDVFYRQGGSNSAEFSLADTQIDVRLTNGAAGGHATSVGRMGVDAEGFVLTAPFARTDIAFDLAYKAKPVASDFEVTGRSPLLHFGWHGGLVNPVWRLGGGGYGYSSYLDGASTFQDYDGAQTGSRSQGVNFLSEWDFDSDFRLDLGEAGGNGTFASLSNWVRLGAEPGPMFSFPLVFDVFQGGAGPAGLCAGNATAGVMDQTSCLAVGGGWVPSDGPGANEAAFGILLRDARLLAYGSRVQVTDPASGNAVTPIDWGLAFTYGKLDADIFLYPEGRAEGVAVATTPTGLRVDVTALAQSPDAWRRATSSSAAIRSTAGNGWETNTHFMVADTATPGHPAVGIMNGDILYRARDLYVRVVEEDSGYPDLPGGVWLQTDNLAQYRFRGIFGGGNLNDLSYDATVKISLVDINLSTDRFIFVLNPLPANMTTGAAPVGFNGLLNFDSSAFMSFGEISSPQSTFFINDVGGSVAWRDGALSLVSGQVSTDGLPQLSVKNDLMLGESAHFGDDNGQPLVGRAGFGTEDFGRIAFPSGTWNSEVIVKIPN